ncbi:MAG: flavodoxin domain-containing protein [Lachnospiraceae bacterium]|nr:flavodoxin domain-containing protein [Lachnospiraceae bacterium]
MKLAVIYDSRTGNTKQAAEWIAEGMRRVEGVDAAAFSIEAVDEDYVTESKGVVIGSPSYCALMTPEMRTWLFERAMHMGLAGKLGGAFATEQYTHGGGEMVIQSILTNELVYGMLCYSGGVGCGKPFIHLGPVGVNGNMEAHNRLDLYKDYFVIYGERFAKKAAEIS